MSLKIVFILGISVPAFEKFNSQSKINLLLGTAISYGGRRGGLAVLQGIKFFMILAFIHHPLFSFFFFFGLLVVGAFVPTLHFERCLCNGTSLPFFLRVKSSFS